MLDVWMIGWMFWTDERPGVFFFIPLFVIFAIFFKFLFLLHADRGS